MDHCWSISPWSRPSLSWRQGKRRNLGSRRRRAARQASGGECAIPHRRRPSPAGQAGLARPLGRAPRGRDYEPARGPRRGTGHPTLKRPRPSIPDGSRGFPPRPMRPVLDPRREPALLEVPSPVLNRRRGSCMTEQSACRNPQARLSRGDRGRIFEEEAGAKPRAGVVNQQAADRKPDDDPGPAAEHNHGPAKQKHRREEEPTGKEERIDEERVAEEGIEEKRVEAARAEEKRPEEKRVAEREAETEGPGPTEPVSQTQADGRGVRAVVRPWRRDGV